MDRTSEFQEATSRVSRESLVDALEAAKKGDAAGQLQVAATMTWAAFSCPDATSAVYDNIASVWLSDGEQREIDESLPEAPLREGFWETYWAVIEDSRAGVIPSKANAQITSLAFESHPDFVAIAERSAQNHTRAQAALAWPPASGLNPDVLRSCPAGSLGQTLYGMIVGHGYSQELVDRRLQELSSLPESLRRVNSRVLHMHRPWQLVAGYDAADAHEIAFGGFQMAQFGLNQAAMVLASFATIGCFLAPTGFYILLYLIAEGWRHGEDSPDFMAIDWESEWVHSIETIRERHGIDTFRSVFSSNLFEVFGSPAN
ncbi:MAG: Coq4 family protein [Gammaproteobacteria bacterium]|nr:Coq4 family protein [Gammaproteobacteria bacterium]